MSSKFLFMICINIISKPAKILINSKCINSFLYGYVFECINSSVRPVFSYSHDPNHGASTSFSFEVVKIL